MTVRILSIATEVPHTRIRQEDVAEVFADQPGMTRLGSRLVRSTFRAAGVTRRHTVLPELGGLAEAVNAGAAAPSTADDGPPAADAARPTTPSADDVPPAVDSARSGDDVALPVGGPPHPGATSAETDTAPSPFVDPANGHLFSPGTHARNQIYTEHARRLFVAAARAALAGSPLAAQDVTHVVTVSCTGFFAPGPDVRVVKDLGLRADVARTHLGFMGCNAAFPALRSAATVCRADPDAVVLVVCVELCTLHLHVRNDPDTVMGNALFADGAAATVVTAREIPAVGASLELFDFETTLAPVGEDELAWSVGDEGFEMILGTYVPRIVEEHVSDALAPLLRRANENLRTVRHWAVHPGGRGILDKVESRLGLTPEQMAPSREVLRDAGNMSSATILFVLERILAAGSPGLLAAMAFGPGLSIESALLRVVPGTAAAAAPVRGV